MKRENALTMIQERVALGRRDYYNEIKDYIDALSLAADALQKQIAVKPRLRRKHKDGYDVGLCTTCGGRTVSLMRYCNHCGQKIMWEVETDGSNS